MSFDELAWDGPLKLAHRLLDMADTGRHGCEPLKRQGTLTASNDTRWRFAGLPTLGRWKLESYLAVVTIGGIGLLGVTLSREGHELLGILSPQVTVFVAFILFGELLTIKAPRHDDSITTSSSFVYALMLTSGAPAAMLAQAVASLIANIRERKSAVASAFKIGQQTIALGVAGLFLSVLSDLPSVSGSAPLLAHDLPAILISGGAYFLTNNVLARTASALWLNLPVSDCHRSDFVFQALTAAVFLSLAPIIVVVAEFDLALVGMLVLPFLAIWKVEHDAVRNEHQALHDSLTGLPNRVLFADRVRQKVIDSNREVSSFAVLLMDLDHFKEINDTLGHHHGDLLLQQVGIRLRHVLRDGDTVARMGGDEFAILLSRVSDPGAAGGVAEKVLQALHQPFQVQGLSLELGASIGIACCPDHGNDLETLLQHADVAMFLAKETRNGYELYSAERDHHSTDRLALAGEMRRAIDAADIGLYLQPTIDLRSGRVVGAEALARWIHPERGVIAPMEFIPIAEQTGLIRPLTMRLLRTALGELRRWHDEGFELGVAVNISPRHLLDQQLPGDIARLLEQLEISPRWLKLEITESTMLADPRQADARRAERVIGDLHSMGVKMSIDDFGTGHSSLAYLKRLPLDEIKIDKSFVMNMSKSSSDAFIVSSTIDLGRNLGLEVVAEGVETQGIADDLVALACDRAQGYHFCRPLPPEDFVAWLHEHQPSVPVEIGLSAIAPLTAPASA